jgi:hypothetical protein
MSGTSISILAMTDGGYLVAGWGGALALVAGYALVVVRRGRKLSRRVPPGERRWS